MSEGTSRDNAVSVLLMVIFILGGCSSASREPQSPLQETPESFSRSGSDTVPDSWWTTFDDPQLNEFIDRALEKNFDVRTAWNRLEASRAVLERTSADLYPELTGSVSGDVRRTDSSQSFTSQDEEIRLGLSADYEVDLWGRIDSTVEAERFRTRATRQDYQTAAISLTAEVTRVWFQLLRQHQQHQLLQRQIETNRDVLELLKKQFGAGQVRQADLLRQEQLLESTREQKIDIESSIQVLEHQLAVLLGRPPQGELEYQVDELPTLPPLPRTGLPVELIRRRPDVRSAFNQLQAADREVAAAISNQYPRLRFTASLSTFDDNSTTLFEDWARSFAGELTAPLLDANRRDAEVNRTEAVRNQRLYKYGQAILTAFQGVEDALVREKKQQEQITNLKGQLDLAERTVKRLRSQYLRGQGNYIDVLNALNEEQQLRRDLLNARLNLLETRVALYRAMAGGFENPESRTGASTPEETNQ